MRATVGGKAPSHLGTDAVLEFSVSLALDGEPLSAGLKELLAFDGGWIGIDYDEDEAEIEGTSIDEIVEEAFGEEAVAAFAEATRPTFPQPRITTIATGTT